MRTPAPHQPETIADGNPPRRLTILGATGSIGRSTMDVVAHLGGPAAFRVEAVTGMDNIDLLARQARALGAAYAATANADKYAELKSALEGSGIACGAGPEAVIEAAERDSDIVMAAIIGIAGLAPTLAAAARGADIALANKECLVSAGELFRPAAAAGGGRLLPVDSEHNAIHQCLAAGGGKALERIVLTASGGPFRDYSQVQMAAVTPQTAAAHPNWSMGVKISIDSASMFNKALEMIEARHLFDVRPDQIEVLIHPQSVIHSMVGYADGSVLAQLGVPDMRTAIGYALAYPERPHLPVDRLDFASLSRLDFHAPDEARFPPPLPPLDPMQRGGLAGAVLNGAKECALEAFIAGDIGFLDMAEIVERAMTRLADAGSAIDMRAVYECDAAARRIAEEEIAALRNAA
jgi:1-deoxy-D-xylulose-5-phosphate reductoisomerase